MLKKILFSCIMSTVKMFSLSNSRMQNHRSVSCLFSIAWRVQNLDYFTSFFLRILICHLFSILFPFTGTYFVILLPSSPAFCQPSPFPLPKIFLTFFSPGTMQVGRILLSLSWLHLVVLCSSLFYFSRSIHVLCDTAFISLTCTVAVACSWSSLYMSSTTACSPGRTSAITG